MLLSTIRRETIERSQASIGCDVRWGRCERFVPLPGSEDVSDELAYDHADSFPLVHAAAFIEMR